MTDREEQYRQETGDDAQYEGEVYKPLFTNWLIQQLDASEERANKAEAKVKELEAEIEYLMEYGF